MESYTDTLAKDSWTKIATNDGRVIIENIDSSGILIWKLMDTDTSPASDDEGHKVYPGGIRSYTDDGRYLYVRGYSSTVKVAVS